MGIDSFILILIIDSPIVIGSLIIDSPIAEKIRSPIVAVR
jgi:hypothetical protein